MKPFAVGECDACPKVDVDLFKAPGSSYQLCLMCYQAEVDAMESSKKINVVAESLKQIGNTQLKADIYNAGTTSFIELHAAIQADDSIPAEKKNEVLVQTAEKYIAQFTETIFSLNEKKVAEENKRAGFRQGTMDYIATLREAEREKYKKFNISYTPAVVTKKAIKGETTRKPRANKQSVTANMAESKRVAEKYGLSWLAIHSLVVSKNISYEDAAIELCKMLKKDLPVAQ